MPPRRHHPVALLILAALLVPALALVTGCGAAPSALSAAVASGPSDTPVPPGPAVAVPSPAATAPPAAAPQPAPTRRSVAEAPGLPWPATTAAGAADLQKAVDGGSQPWLLDPTEVAESYGAFRGWENVQASGGGGATPTHVTLRSSAGTRTLTLTQTGRRGQGGIWLVTGDSAG